MDSGYARELFERLSGALAYVEVEKPDGDLGIGSAFHVGEGVFVTARHVVEGMTVREVCMTETFDVEPTEEETATVNAFTVNGPIHNAYNGVVQMTAGPYFHPDPRVDVAAFRAGPLDPRTPAVPLGNHLDDHIGLGSMVLTEAVVLGYPPIPMTARPILVGARAEVNAHDYLYDSPNLHFILSATARGGFSGGVAFSEHGYALGLVTRSLAEGRRPAESGYMAVLGTRALYECLAEHRMVPAAVSETWRGFWDTNYLTFTGPAGPTMPHMEGVSLVTAMFSIVKNARASSLELSCDDPVHLAAAEKAATQSLSGRAEEIIRSTRACKIEVSTTGDSTDKALDDAARAAAEALVERGYRLIPKPDVPHWMLPDI